MSSLLLTSAQLAPTPGVPVIFVLTPSVTALATLLQAEPEDPAASSRVTLPSPRHMRAEVIQLVCAHAARRTYTT